MELRVLLMDCCYSLSPRSSCCGIAPTHALEFGVFIYVYLCTPGRYFFIPLPFNRLSSLSLADNNKPTRHLRVLVYNKSGRNPKYVQFGFFSMWCLSRLLHYSGVNSVFALLSCARRFFFFFWDIFNPFPSFVVIHYGNTMTRHNITIK